MGVYDPQIEVAKRLIKDKGMQCIWRVMPVGKPPDCDEPWNVNAVGEASVIKHTVNVCFVSDTVVNAISGLRVNRSDDTPETSMRRQFGIMGQVPFEVALNHELQVNSGARLRLVNVRILSPNGEIILYGMEFAG